MQGADHTPELPLQNDGTPVLFLLTPNATQLLDISTCNPGTTTPTVLAIIDAATLEPIRQAGGTTDKVWVAKGLWWWRCLEGVGGVVWCVWVWVTGGRCGGRGVCVQRCDLQGGAQFVGGVSALCSCGCIEAGPPPLTTQPQPRTPDETIREEG